MDIMVVTDVFICIGVAIVGTCFAIVHAPEPRRNRRTPRSYQRRHWGL